MKLVVGLGNPGREYEGTRHNIGFQLLAEMSRRYDGGRPKSKFQAELIEVLVGAERVLLLAPQTYMNLSGSSVQKALEFYQFPLADLMVVCDDLNLPLGRIRIRTVNGNCCGWSPTSKIRTKNSHFKRLPKN